MRARPYIRLLFIAVGALVLLSGCTRSETETAIPEGWEGTDTRWWRVGIDTTGLFRPLDTFEEMGIPYRPVVFVGPDLDRQPKKMQEQLINAVKRELLPLYRTNPEIVDSLFQKYVVPAIKRSSPPRRARFEATVTTWKSRAYRTIARYYREPRPRLRIGKDIKVPYPDSLMKQGIGGKVRMQVYVNEQGEPVAIWLLQSVHPVLDRIAMRATTRMRWSPAYLNGKPVPAWVRFSISFTPPPSD